MVSFKAFKMDDNACPSSPLWGISVYVQIFQDLVDWKWPDSLVSLYTEFNTGIIKACSYDLDLSFVIFFNNNDVFLEEIILTFVEPEIE